MNEHNQTNNEVQESIIQNNEQTQNVLIRIMREEFRELKDSNTQEHKEIKDSTASKQDLYRIVESQKGRISMLQKDVDDHCLRIRASEQNITLIAESIKPTQEFVKDLQGKILTGFFALLTILGAIIYAAIKYIDKKNG